MESFFSLLERRVDDCSSLLCVGLDPHAADLHAPTAAAALEFCTQLVRSTARFAAAFKPNAAFFEVLGPDGWAALREVIEVVRAESQRLGSHIPVILDAKRGDIASTAQAYATSAFEKLGADAITLSPFLGKDSIEPFIMNPEKGAFLLCKTSNAGSLDVQDVEVLPVGSESPMPLYTYVARLAVQWNAHNNVGLVAGATHLESIASIRGVAPRMWLLSPGVGAQGGDIRAALRSGLRPDGKGILVNVSRAISGAADPGKAAADLRDVIAEERGRVSGGAA